MDSTVEFICAIVRRGVGGRITHAGIEQIIWI